MKLSEEDATLFYSIWFDLISSININHKNTGKNKKRATENQLNTSLGTFTELRNHMWDNPVLIDNYLNNKRGEISEEVHEIISGWRQNYIKDAFLVSKYLKNYTVLLSCKDPQRLFGISGIVSDFSETCQNKLPCSIQTVLIPFKGRIIFDGICRFHDYTFTSKFIPSLNIKYREIKSKYGIITSLPIKAL